MGGWWGEYSFRCQPVDKTSSPTATRVSSCRSESAKYVIFQAFQIYRAYHRIG